MEIAGCQEGPAQAVGLQSDRDPPSAWPPGGRIRAQQRPSRAARAAEFLSDAEMERGDFGGI
jgi:hypothetical protein